MQTTKGLGREGLGREGLGRMIRIGVVAACLAGLVANQVPTYAALTGGPAQRNASQGIAPGALIINEVAAANLNGLRDEEDSSEDWIELYNASGVTLNLGGVGLSDSATSPFKWVFSNTTTIMPGAYLVVFASKKDRRVITSGHPAARLHTNFSLKNGTEALVLTGPNGTTLDTYSARFTKVDNSFGRQPDGSMGGTSIETFVVPTPGSTNSTPSFATLLSAPMFSVGGGFYTNTVTLALSSSVPGAVIRYTLDGSEPVESSAIYTAPLSITQRLSDPNFYSIIPSIPVTFFIPPVGNVYKSTVVRSVAFMSGAISSTIGTHTYFVDPNIASKYAGIAVVSLAVEPNGFFSDERGIYVPGLNFEQNPPHYNANFWLDEERPVHIEYYATNRTLGFALDAGTEIQGNFTRSYPSHSLGLKMRDAYGVDELNYPLFADKTNTRFKRLALWNAGNDFRVAFMRDAFAQGLMKGSTLDFAADQPAVVFINGEYWGLLRIRERANEHFVETYYGVDSDAQDFLEDPTDTFAYVNSGDSVHYLNMVNFVKNNVLSDTTNYETLKTMMDTQQFAEYMAAEMYMVNRDWPTKNVKLWRPRTPTGYWRWLLQDLDFTFNLFPVDLNHTYNMLNWYFNEAPEYSTFLGRLLQQNSSWRNHLINASADQMNQFFLPGRMTTRFNTMTTTIAPFMAEHRQRWPNGNSNTWAGDLPYIQEFIDNRTPIHRQHLINHFGLAGMYTPTLQINIANAGSITFNTLDLSSVFTGATTSWQGVYFQGVPVQAVAVARAGYQFVGWAGASTSLSSTITLTPTSAFTLTAVFAAGGTPTPHNLASGAYTFTQWLSTSVAGSYPAAMQFRQVLASATDPGLGVDMDSAWTLPYSLTSRSRINGEGGNGVSFINTSNQNVGGGYAGAADVWLNTIGQNNVCVTWTGGTVLPNSVSYAVRLQYRVGGSGVFSDVLDSNNAPVEYVRNVAVGHSQIIGPVALPATALNQPSIELRWRYYFTGGSTSGSRAQLRLDEVTVQGSPTPCAAVLPTPTPTSTPVATATATATPTATPTSTPAATATSTPTATPTSTPAATATSTPTPTSTPAATATSTPTATPTSTSAATATATPTATPTSTPAATATATPTATPTSTPAATATATPTSTATPLPTSTPQTLPLTATTTPSPTRQPLVLAHRSHLPLVIGSNQP